MGPVGDGRFVDRRRCAVAERLSAVDASFLYSETPDVVMHVGSLSVFDPPPGRSGAQGLDGVVELVAERIAVVPRYRQRVRAVPAHLAPPVWVDDERFDLAYHVRRSSLPRPGSHEQLLEHVSRIMGRPLDRSRPLWELYLIEGLTGDRFAVLAKVHHAMAGGLAPMELGQEPRHSRAPWLPQAEPSRLELLVGAVADIVRDPSLVRQAIRVRQMDVTTAIRTARSVTRDVLGEVVEIVEIVARLAPPGPLNRPIGRSRRVATATLPRRTAEDLAQAQGVSVEDVVLAALSGAVRSWLIGHGHVVAESADLRALTVTADLSGAGTADPTGTTVPPPAAVEIVSLPVGEPSPQLRLMGVAHDRSAQPAGALAAGVSALVGVAGFAPPTLHALAARAAVSASHRAVNLVVTMATGAATPRYAAGSRLTASFPVMPLLPGHVLAVGVTAYDEGLYVGLTADRDEVPDVGALAALVTDAFTELAEPGPRRPRSMTSDVPPETP